MWLSLFLTIAVVTDARVVQAPSAEALALIQRRDGIYYELDRLRKVRLQSALIYASCNAQEHNGKKAALQIQLNSLAVK